LRENCRYQQHIRGSETWPAKLQRTFSGTDSKNVAYTGGLPRPQARFVADFCKLLEMRDQKLSECADSPVMEEKKHKLTGITVTPAPQSIYFRQIELLSGDTEDTVALSDVCRPYFVIQNEKGVLFSSMINGVRNVDLHGGPHVFRVWKQLKDCRDLVFKMYHLPFGRQGELIFECRLHVSMLLDRTQDGTFESIKDDETREVVLSVENGDFDCIASWYTLPKQFAVKILFARDASAFGSEPPFLPAQDADDSYDTDAVVSSLSAQSQPRSFHGPSSTPGQPCDPKPIRYDGPSVVSFLVDQPNIRTAFGDCRLDKIDVLRRVQRNRLDIFLLFHVEIVGGVTKVLPYRHLFRYILPEPIRERMILMGATEDSLNETSPAAFFEGPGKLTPSTDYLSLLHKDSPGLTAAGMPFDEEYARWLQHQYDTDFGMSVGVAYRALYVPPNG